MVMTQHIKDPDHTREFIPILVCGKSVKHVNIEELEKHLRDIATTVEEILLGTENEGSFAKEILG